MRRASERLAGPFALWSCMDSIAGEPFDRAERDLGERAAGVSLCVETTFRTSMYGGIYATATSSMVLSCYTRYQGAEVLLLQ